MMIAKRAPILHSKRLICVHAMRLSKVLLTGVLAFLLIMSGCGFIDNDVSKEIIVEYVIQNYEELEAFPLDSMPHDSSDAKDYIREALGRKTIVKSIYRYSDNIIDFYCGGTGLATNSTYSGFYYSADDTPFALEFPTDELEETSPGVFEWASGSGEKIVTERILPCWFYYHMVWY